MENIERLTLYIFPLFHGILSAYLVSLLTDLQISEAYFILLVIVCACLNLIVARIILFAIYAIKLGWQKFLLRKARRANEDPSPLQARIDDTWAVLYRIRQFAPDDLLARPGLRYFGICVVAGIFTGYFLSVAYADDWVLGFFSDHLHWQKRTDRNPLEQFFWTACSRSKSCKNDSKQYMRVWWKDGGVVVAGKLQDIPTGKDRYIVGLSGSCEIVVNTSLKSVEILTQTQPSAQDNGISVFVDLANPNIVFTEVLTNSNPCEPGKYKARP